MGRHDTTSCLSGDVTPIVSFVILLGMLYSYVVFVVHPYPVVSVVYVVIVVYIDNNSG
jgi:hypothetical protein